MTKLHSTARIGRVRAALAVAVLALSAATPVFAQTESPARGEVTVDEVVRRALEHNHDLLTARENIESAAGRKNQALQRYLPSVTAGIDYQRSFDERFFLQGGVEVPSSADNYSTVFGVSQTLIDWSAYKSIQAANRNLDANKFDYDQARADIVLLAKQQYYTLLRAQLLAEVADSALLVSQQDLRRVQSLFDLGMVARGDVLKAQVRLSQSQLEVISTRNVVVLERARLAALMGQDPNDDLAAVRDLTPTPAVVDSAAVFNEALVNRPDLKAAEAALAAQNANLGAAKAGYYPTVGAGVRYSYSHDKLTISEEVRSRNGAVSIDIPIFASIWGTKGAIQQSRAARNQAGYAYDRLRLDVQVEVREAVSTARQANEGLIVAQEQVESAREDLKLSQEKYNVGSGTILELIDAQVALVRARSNYVQALTQVRSAEARLERVRGRTY
jgi:outer membrane protein